MIKSILFLAISAFAPFIYADTVIPLNYVVHIKCLEKGLPYSSHYEGTLNLPVTARKGSANRDELEGWVMRGFQEAKPRFQISAQVVRPYSTLESENNQLRFEIIILDASLNSTAGYIEPGYVNFDTLDFFNSPFNVYAQESDILNIKPNPSEPCSVTAKLTNSSDSYLFIPR